MLPDEKYLEQLYLMGYSHDVAKKALIEVKNAGVVEAIDAIPNIIQSMKEIKKEINSNKIL